MHVKPEKIPLLGTIVETKSEDVLSDLNFKCIDAIRRWYFQLICALVGNTQFIFLTTH